ncbi:MAG: GIY-YIG nuclease family protein [Oscillospiraceae bacterium]|jgi:putative endonuclease|nr:GIY-YIG nuclease family protein [Oscillospiraceae bacterium]
MNYTYMLRCADGTLYTGWTNDPKKRLAAHNAGKGAKYTRTRLPVTMVYAESHEDKREAMRREYQIKHLSRMEKLKLLSSSSNLMNKS